MARLDGKVAVITGGSSGIGLASAQRFVEEGAYVFITGRRQSELDKAKALIGDGVTTVAVDSTKSADLDRLFATVLEAKGALDILLVNSGRVEPEELGKITEGTGIDARGRLRRSGRLGRGLRRHFWLQHLQRHQGRTALLCADLDPGVQRPGYPVQHIEPGPDRHPHHGRPGELARGSRPDPGDVRRGDTTEPDGPPGRDRGSRIVLGL
jgi:NAD(P)-dependent dehydrogenase (short-subunit alcohol dehydrogenase family)